MFNTSTTSCDLVEQVGIDTQVVLHAMPGIAMQTFGDRWLWIYLPAMAPYLVRGADLDSAPTVRLPEGPRDRRSKLETRIGCVRSPAAALTCEGPALGRETRGLEHEDSNGHVWVPMGAGGWPHCVRCQAIGGIKALSAGYAPSPWSTLPVWRQPGLGKSIVTCAVGDEATRNKLLGGTLDYLSGGFGRQIYTTTPQQRRAIFERASNPFDVGGRWQLADDVTPETAPDFEAASWVDLADLLLGVVSHLTPDADPRPTLQVWCDWLDGLEEAPPRSHWDPIYADLMLRVVAGLVQRPGIVYIDARKLLTALARTDVSGRIRMSHPAEELVRDLRAQHDKIRDRDERASVLVLFPAECEADKTTGLGGARRVWASGR